MFMLVSPLVSLVMPMMLVMLLHEFELMLLRLPAAFEFEHRMKLMRLGQLAGRLQKVTSLLEPERLPSSWAAFRFQRYILFRDRRGGVSVLVKKIEAKSWRHILLKNADFNPSVLRFEQWPAIRPV